MPPISAVALDQVINGWLILGSPFPWPEASDRIFRTQ
jgi:hypothetical protein